MITKFILALLKQKCYYNYAIALFLFFIETIEMRLTIKFILLSLTFQKHPALQKAF